MTLPQDKDQDKDIARLQSEMSAAVRAHWKVFLIEGILLAILGLAAMTTSAATYFWYFSYDSSLAAGGSRSIQ